MSSLEAKMVAPGPNPVTELNDSARRAHALADIGGKHELIAFDGDDTLWKTQHLYDAAKDELELLAKDLGIWDAELRHKLDTVDAERVKLLGFSRDRFPGSLVEVLRLYATKYGRKLPGTATRGALRIGASVFNAAAPVQIGAPSLLQALSQKYRLVLITKGDPLVQQRRLTDSRLRGYFESVYIVGHKSADVLRQIFESKGIEPSRVIVVGDSLKSDVRPALDAGATAIWVPSQSWQYERTEIPCCDRFSKIDSLQELSFLL